MKTSSKTLDGPEANPRQIKGHNLNGNNAPEKEHQTSEISSKQIFSLKKKLTLLITIAIALAAFLMTACEDDPQPCTNCVTRPPAPAPNPIPPTEQISIRSIHPSTGAPGSTVTIVLENFSNPTSDQYVTFGASFAEIIYARYGMMNVRVPMDLENGDYSVKVRSNGQVARAPQEFKVTRGTD